MPCSTLVVTHTTSFTTLLKLAKFLKCSVPTVCRIVKSGKIDSAMRKVGGTYWFQATKCKINSWHQFSEAISTLAIVAGIITIITKGINK